LSFNFGFVFVEKRIDQEFADQLITVAFLTKYSRNPKGSEVLSNYLKTKLFLMGTISSIFSLTF
jgi:hypothetical protein